MNLPRDLRRRVTEQRLHRGDLVLERPCRLGRYGAGALFILAGVIANMSIYFRPTSLFNTPVMLILLVGGLGLIARALRPHPAAKSE